jgi:hydrogenase nickel incorporation protein HypA/HybF
MHEYSVVQELVDKLLHQMEEKGIDRVKQIRLRRGSTFAEAPLQQAFFIMTENTPLEGTELVIDSFNVENKCASCGHSQVVTSDDLIGHLFVCPECGAAIEIDEAHGLELVDIVY